MSTLWTPEGERPVGRESEQQTGPTDHPEGEPSDEEMAAQLQDMREQLSRTPVETVIANHAFGLFELAALHLSQQPPQLEQARLAIDAMATLVEGLAGRLGEPEQQLNDGLAQLRLAFVQIRSANQEPGSTGPSESTPT